MRTVEQAWDDLVARRGGAVWQLVCTDVREAFAEGWKAAMEDVNALLTEQALKVHKHPQGKREEPAAD